jgi:glycosyltransferase involved in cell wall biosynthesis
MITRNARRPSSAVESALVSVIIPVFQGERFIRGAVRSALNQTHENLEVFVVDDGSTDATLEVLATIADPRLRVLRQRNSGTGAARNLALERARGRYIAFLDCDDRWFPTKLALEIDALRCAPRPAAIAYSSYYAVDDRGRLLHRAPLRVRAGNVFETLLEGEDFLMPSVCLFDRAVFETLGTFKADRYHEDHEFILRACRRYGVAPTGQRTVVYRQSTGGKCRGILSDFERARTEEFALMSDLADTLTPEQYELLRENLSRSLYCRFLMYGFAAHARRMLPEVDVAGLRTSKKGWLAWLFAKTGINLLVWARVCVQGFHRAVLGGAWTARLRQRRLDLQYE